MIYGQKGCGKTNHAAFLQPSTGTTVYSRDGKVKGVVVNPTDRSCGVEGCQGTVLSVRWPDKKITYCCTAGMTWRKRSWRIM